MKHHTFTHATISMLAAAVFLLPAAQPASAQISIIDCPADTTTYRGGRIDLCPLHFTNPEETAIVISYYVEDSRGWLNSMVCAGHTPGPIGKWEEFDICAAWPGLGIEAYQDAVHGEWTDVRIVVHGCYDSHPRPVLTIEAEGVGAWSFQGMEDPPVDLSVPGGTTLDLTWWGDASANGAVAAGYRHGWDMTDPMNDAEWDCRFDPVPGHSSRTFPAGIHTLTVELVDDSGAFTRGSVNVAVVAEAGEILSSRAPAEATSGGGRDPVGCAGECTFRVTIDNSVATRQSTWGRIKLIHNE